MCILIGLFQKETEYMSKQVYISADYDQNNGDQAVVEELTKWGVTISIKLISLICQKYHPEA